MLVSLSAKKRTGSGGERTDRHPRWTFHFAPTSASIKAYLAEHNASPKPLVWTESAGAILGKLHPCPVSEARKNQ
jgi:hypothetical protein